MKIINLMENTIGENKVYAEHGFCVYLETPKHKILADTGASEKTWENAEKLGVDLPSIDLVFLSHGHYDHSGGILSFAEQNPHAKIYIHSHAVYDYYNLKDGREKYIGIDKRIPNLPQLVFLENGCKIDQEISIFSGVAARRKWPKSNLTLKRKTGDSYVQDSFDHEQYLVVEAEGKKVLVSGCAHNGILNILDRFRELYQCDPDVVISGFHMMKKTGDEMSPNRRFDDLRAHQCASAYEMSLNRRFDDLRAHQCASIYDAGETELIRDVAKELCELDTQFYTGHCTGMPAFEMMKEIMGDKLRYMHSGDVINVTGIGIPL